MQNASLNDFAKPKDFDISEIESSTATTENDIIKAGVVPTWKPISNSDETERSTFRPKITVIMLLIWATAIFVGLIKYIATGDAMLFMGSNLLLIPVCIVLRFYY